MSDLEINLRPAVTAAVTRGVVRAFLDLGYMPVLEVPLANGRRADVCGVNQRGEIAIAEVKSCVADFAVDSKWP
ncbi:MAG: MmcB family DNA repair protein, partial [Caulobacterales bacterium]